MKRLLSILLFILVLNTAMEAQDYVIYPEPLKKGDKIAILAPAGPVRADRVQGAAEVIRNLGYEVEIYPTVYMHNGQFSGSTSQRLADLKRAFADPEVRAILCARGGYGIVHNLDSLATIPVEEDPKWVIGFSDISALHAFMASKGIASIHGSMALHIARGMDEPENVTLFEILEDSFPTYKFEPDVRNHEGRAEGKIVGGNLSVLQALINTPYNIFEPGTILFLEDVGEPIYKIERMFYQLRLSGLLDNIEGLLIGKFTEYRPDENHSSMEEMIAEVLSDYPDLPVAFNVPVGHVRHNVPMIESAYAVMEVTPDSVTLKFSK